MAAENPVCSTQNSRSFRFVSLKKEVLINGNFQKNQLKAPHLNEKLRFANIFFEVGCNRGIFGLLLNLSTTTKSFQS
jgi:hypothetical protein